jgi:hypothetical protein|tara:strand:- start:323 stop:502 length:180 start_codon:yes stop_codon:yes gene_type:complete
VFYDVLRLRYNILISLKIKQNTKKMEGEQGEQDVYDQSFIDQPAILDKYKAAAVVADGK